MIEIKKKTVPHVYRNKYLRAASYPVNPKKSTKSNTNK